MKLNIYYDPEGDFLEIGLGEPKPGYHEELGDGITVRKEKGTNRIIGYTIMSLSKRGIWNKDFPMEVVYSDQLSLEDVQKILEKHSSDKIGTGLNKL